MNDPKQMFAMLLQLLEIELREYAQYREKSEGSFRLDLAGIGTSGKELKPNEQEEYFDWMQDEIEQLRDSFPQILRGSSLVALFSIFEHTLTRMCRILQNDIGLTLTPGDMAGQGTQAVQRFVKKACNRKFPDQSAEWWKIQDLRRIRNCIVHSGGKVLAGSGVEKSVWNIPGASLDSQRQVVLNDSTIDELSTCILKFFQACESHIFVPAM